MNTYYSPVPVYMVEQPPQGFQHKPFCPIILHVNITLDEALKAGLDFFNRVEIPLSCLDTSILSAEAKEILIERITNSAYSNLLVTAEHLKTIGDVKAKPPKTPEDLAPAVTAALMELGATRKRNMEKPLHEFMLNNPTSINFQDIPQKREPEIEPFLLQLGKTDIAQLIDKHVNVMGTRGKTIFLFKNGVPYSVQSQLQKEFQSFTEQQNNEQNKAKKLKAVKKSVGKTSIEPDLPKKR